MKDLEHQTKAAVKQFWTTRGRQKQKQAERGVTDQGARIQATGGKQMDGFAGIIAGVLLGCGLPKEEIFYRRSIQLPGYYRPEKKWDVLVVSEGKLVVVIPMC